MKNKEGKSMQSEILGGACATLAVCVLIGLAAIALAIIWQSAGSFDVLGSIFARSLAHF